MVVPWSWRKILDFLFDLENEKCFPISNSKCSARTNNFSIWDRISLVFSLGRRKSTSNWRCGPIQHPDSLFRLPPFRDYHEDPRVHIFAQNYNRFIIFDFLPSLSMYFPLFCFFFSSSSLLFLLHIFPSIPLQNLNPYPVVGKVTVTPLQSYLTN